MPKTWMVAIALLVSVASCTNETEESEADVGKKGLVPWHMWGQSVTLPYDNRLGAGVGASLTYQTVQLIQVTYLRPESWNFLLEAKLIDVNPTPPISGAILDITIQLQLGLGRSTVILDPFAALRFNTATDPGLQRFVTSVNGRPRNPGDVTQNVVETFVAQSIQAKATLKMEANDINFGTIELTFFVSPVTHIRPEWYLSDAAPDEKFPGDEHKGH